MTIGISRDRAAPDLRKVVMHALLVSRLRSTDVAMAHGRRERSAA